jgi:hypothetical protein
MNSGSMRTPAGASRRRSLNSPESSEPNRRAQLDLARLTPTQRNRAPVFEGQVAARIDVLVNPFGLGRGLTGELQLSPTALRGHPVVRPSQRIPASSSLRNGEERS